MQKRCKLRQSVQRYVQCLAAGAASAALVPGVVMAQGADDAAGNQTLEEVVVTGTLIRGIEPTGTVPIGIDSDAMLSSGAVTTNELLATVPQVSNYFNTRAEQDPRGAQQTIINRPNLRNLPNFNSASGTTTLVLVDGHRITPLGLDQASLDPDVVPGSVVERVEIVTDGGSSLYGADAVGGVINFVTKKEFDGVQVDLSYGVGDDYDTADISLTGGTSWNGGSILVSLHHDERDGLKNADRDWAKRGDWTENGVIPNDTECIVPVGAITTYYNYGGTPTTWTDNPRAPGAGVTPVGEPCSTKDQESLLPEQERDNFWVSFSQDLSDTVAFNMQSYYAERNTEFTRYPLGDTVSGASPADLMVPGNAGDLYEVAAIGFSYGANAAYNHRNMEIDWETWGFSPEFTLQMDNGWQLRQTFHYGRSKTSLVDPLTNRTTMLGYYDDGNGPFDPANVAAADAAIIDDILDWEYAGETVQEMFLARMVADGAVMELPAGEVNVAAGIEWTEDRARKRLSQVPIGGLDDVKSRENSRDIMAFFGEVNVPVLDTLDLSLSVRRDDYSDFGDTTNPNIGLNFTPVDWVLIFGHWGEAFNAPTAVDGLATATIRNLTFGTIGGVPNPLNVDTHGGTNVLQITGATGGTLLPQTAETWAAGFEIEPPAVEGLRFGVTYYEIEFDDILGAADPQLESAVLASPEKFVFGPTQEELDSFLALVDNADQYPDIVLSDLGLILDRRTSNTDSAKLEGIDFTISYEHDTRIGWMSYGLSGNHALTFDILDSSGVWTDNIAEGVSDLAVSGSVRWAKDNLRARLTLNYTNGFDTSTAELGQTSVDEYLVTDLFVGYDVNESLSLRFNVDNVFDEDPPVWRQSQFNLPYTGFTIGRVYKLGLTYSFF